MGKKHEEALSGQTECEFELTFRTLNPASSIHIRAECELGKLSDTIGAGLQEFLRRLNDAQSPL